MAKHHIDQGLLFREYGVGVKVLGFSDKNDTRTRLIIPEFIYISNNGQLQKWNVEDIEKGAFENNMRLQVVEIPKTVRCIHESAFYNCANLKAVVSSFDGWVHNGLNILKDAFACCTQLEVVDLHRPIHWLTTRAFANCPNLKKFKASIQDVAKDAFTSCQLERLTFYPKCRIHADSIEYSNVKELVFEGELDYAPIKTMKWLKTANIKVCCSFDSDLQDLAYEGVCVETFAPF